MQTPEERKQSSGSNLSQLSSNITPSGQNDSPGILQQISNIVTTDGETKNSRESKDSNIISSEEFKSFDEAKANNELSSGEIRAHSEAKDNHTSTSEESKM